MKRWTDETDREADELYPTFTTAKIRRYQDVVSQQMAMAYQQRDQRPSAMADAMADLQRCHDALSREMMMRVGRKSTGPRIRPERATS